MDNRIIQPEWIPAGVLPENGQLCDIWVDYGDELSEPPHRRIDYVFTGDGFQEADFYYCGLYDMKYNLYEGIVTHWLPAPKPLDGRYE
jgi:hypothetical protein